MGQSAKYNPINLVNALSIKTPQKMTAERFCSPYPKKPHAAITWKCIELPYTQIKILKELEALSEQSLLGRIKRGLANR